MDEKNNNNKSKHQIKKNHHFNNYSETKLLATLEVLPKSIKPYKRNFRVGRRKIPSNRKLVTIVVSVCLVIHMLTSFGLYKIDF